MAARSATANTARRGRARRHRGGVRGRRGVSHLVASRRGPDRQPRPAGRRELRQRLQRRRPRDRRCARRAGAPRRLRAEAAGCGETGRVPRLRRRCRCGARPGGDDIVVAAGRRRGGDRRGVGLHGWPRAVWLCRPRRGLRVRLLRAGGDRGDDVRGRRADHRPRHRHGVRRGMPGVRPAGGQQPARHPVRPCGGQAHAWPCASAIGGRGGCMPDWSPRRTCSYSSLRCGGRGSCSGWRRRHSLSDH